MVEPTNVNIKGKVIIPLPDLCRGLATHSITFDRSRYAKSLYLYGFTHLITDLQSQLTINKDDKGNWQWLDYERDLYPLIGYAVLDSFETYHVIPAKLPINFTLGDTSGWSRPYDFGIYFRNSSKDLVSEGYSLGQRVDGESSMAYPTVIETESLKNKDDSVAAMTRTDLGVIRATNIRTSNAFLYKFGVQLTNPDLQSFTDAGSSFLNDFTH